MAEMLDHSPVNYALLLLLVAAAPQFTVGAWAPQGKGQGKARELRFTDGAGAHVVRFSLSEPKATKAAADDDEGVSVQLQVVHLLANKEVWRAKDFVQACPFDVTLEVLDPSIEVTDLDHDGESEISFVYSVGCRSDVSPLPTKLLLYEGAAKYALRGSSRVKVGDGEFEGGSFEVDPAFQAAPASFLTFAKAKWKANVW